MADDSMLKGPEQVKAKTEADISASDAFLGLHQEAYSGDMTLAMAETGMPDEFNACGPQAPAVDFRDAQKADNQAADFWSKVDGNQTPNFRDILSYKNHIDIAAKQRLSGRGGLGKQTAGNVENLTALAKDDPNKDTRAVPVADPAAGDPPAYLTANMQRCMLANLSLDPKERLKSITANLQKTKLVDAELAYRSNPNCLDPTAEKTLHKAVVYGLKRHFKDAMSENKFATDNGLNAAEMDDLRARYREADTFCKANP